MSVQFYIHDDDEMKAYRVFQAAVEPLRLSVASMDANHDVDPNFGEVIHELGVVPLSNVVQPELFKRIWGRLVGMIEVWGTETLLEFIVAVYGINVDINVDPPMNIGLLADIDPGESVDELWLGQNKFPAVRFEDAEYILGRISAVDYKILFKRLLGDILSIEQLRMLLQHLRPVGERWSIQYRSSL